MKTHILLLPVLTVLLTSCASNHPMVGARRGAGFSPAPTDKIAFTLRPNPSCEDAEVGRILTAELEREGFNLVPLAEADYALTYAIEDDSVESYLPAQNHVSTAPPQTTKDILLEMQASGTQGFQPPAVPTAVVYHAKGIRLYLYTNPKTNSEGIQMAWSGCIDAGEHISAKREPLLIEALLGHFGQDYVGQVSLPK